MVAKAPRDARPAGCPARRAGHDLLEVSRLAREEIRLELGVVDLSEVVSEVQQRLVESGEVARSRCTLRAELGKAVAGQWDRRLLEQVVAKLLSNGLKYGSGKLVT